MEDADFSKFNPRDYLDDYVYGVTAEEIFLLDFYFETYSSVKGGSLLEIGGGPSVYSLISASLRVDSILFAEFLEANRNEVLLFLNNDSSAYNLDSFFEYVSKLEGVSVEKLKESVRKKITVVSCDVRNGRVIDSDELFDVVSINFCLESITGKESEFLIYFDRCVKYLKPGGLLVMGLLRNAKYYTVGDVKFPAFPVDESYMEKLLKSKGFSDIKIKSIMFEDESMDGNIVLRARR